MSAYTYKAHLSIGGGERTGETMRMVRPFSVGERFVREGHTWEVTGVDETPFSDGTGAYFGTVWARRVEVTDT